VEKIAPGTHIVSVIANGYKKSADKVITVAKGQELVLPFPLGKKSSDTGIRVAALAPGLRLTLNGEDKGPLPIELGKLEPGEYSLKITGSDRYDVYEEKVRVESDKMLSVEPKLKVIKGLAHITPGSGADGARILLVSGDDRRPLPKLPIKIDIKPDKPYTLVAKKKGYLDYTQTISFDDGKAEKVFEIVMVPEGKADDDAVAGPSRPATPAPDRSPIPGVTPPAPVEAAPAGQGKLNINSIPASNVILDGRPMGQTPKIGISVPAGTHTVMFVHPEFGRKIQTVTVTSGGTATAAVRFP
jgi:serine/threonine-protein kinase